MSRAISIVLVSLNARYSHANLGLRYLRANLGDLREQSAIYEFTISDNPHHIVESLVQTGAQIIGFGVYIWNILQTEQVVGLLKAVAPEVTVVVGGPEVSFGTEHTRLDTLADVVVSNEADVAFRGVCEDLLGGKHVPPRIDGGQVVVKELVLPYAEYTEEDLKRRIIYVEASRGCPFACEFCLSSMVAGVRTFDLDAFFLAMEDLLQRGCRTFKFVDRTFNLNPRSCTAVLDYFYQRWPRTEDGEMVVPLNKRQMDPNRKRNDSLFLHFEMVPDRLPDVVKERIGQFPAGAIQLEIGIQSFTPGVGDLISRRMDTEATEANLQWLRALGTVHVHADLIIGLPGETFDTFFASFDRLWRLRPDEIQLGILKHLRGTPIIRHQDAYGMVFNPFPPYDIMANKQFPFALMQRMKRFARYFELFVNSGNFVDAIDLLIRNSISNSPGRALLAFSDTLWQQTHQQHAFARERQYDILLQYLLGLEVERDLAVATLRADFLRISVERYMPHCLR